MESGSSKFDLQFCWFDIKDYDVVYCKEKPTTFYNALILAKATREYLEKLYDLQEELRNKYNKEFKDERNISLSTEEEHDIENKIFEEFDKKED